eukprot:1400971-Prymnesium_polylepis.1
MGSTVKSGSSVGAIPFDSSPLAGGASAGGAAASGASADGAAADAIPQDGKGITDALPTPSCSTRRGP